MLKNSFLTAVQDVFAMLRSKHLVLMLGWLDIKQRYRRSKLGPFWLTISMVVMISMIGIIFGQALSVPIKDYFPYIGTGIIFWSFISNTINEGCSAFIGAAGMIRQLSLPLSLYPARILWRNIVVLAHNIIILPFVLFLSARTITFEILWVIPGFVLIVLNIFWLNLFLGVCCTRFRDLPPIVSSLVQILFYITPIIWMPGAINSRFAGLIIDLNPVYHLLELVRGPILGYCPAFTSWFVAICVAGGGLIMSLLFFGFYRKRIAYWV